MKIEDCAFEDNSVVGERGGAVNFRGLQPSSCQIVDCTFIDNASYFDSLFAQEAGGGAACISSGDSTVLVEGCVFKQNHVIGGEFAPDSTAVSRNHAGALYWENTTGRVRNNAFLDNSSFDGGAFYVHSWAAPEAVIREVSGNLFVRNSAGRKGGALLIEHSDWDFSDCTFIANSAVWAGGAVYSEHGERQVTNCAFFENVVSQGNGGAVFLQKAAFHLNGCLLANNVASDDGGAIYWSDSPIVSALWKHVTIAYNRAETGKAGGALLAIASPGWPINLRVRNSIFAFNECGDSTSCSGGAFHIADTSQVTLNLACMDFYGNVPPYVTPPGGCFSCITSDPLFCGEGVCGVDESSPAADSCTACLECDGILGSEGLCLSQPLSGDTYIWEARGTDIYEGGDSLKVGSLADSAYVTILRVKKSDYAAVPSDGRVTGAYVQLYQILPQIGSPMLEVYRGLRTSTILSSTNWYQWRSTYGWAIHGARHPRLDYDGRKVLGSQGAWLADGHINVAYGKQLASWFTDNVQPGCTACGLHTYEYLILHPSSPPGAHEIVFQSVHPGGGQPILTVTYVPHGR